MTDEARKALVEKVAKALCSADAWKDGTVERVWKVYRPEAEAAIAVALEEAAKVAETVGPVVIQDNGDGSKIVNTWRANEIAAAIRALISPSGETPSQTDE